MFVFWSYILHYMKLCIPLNLRFLQFIFNIGLILTIV
jgi:hypothetical protein